MDEFEELELLTAILIAQNEELMKEIESIQKGENQ